MTSLRSRLLPVLGARDREILGSLFSLDTRSLAVLRVGVAIMLVHSALFGYLAPGGPVAASTEAVWSALRLILAISGFLLAAGWRTRAATVICWLIYAHAIRVSFFTPGAPIPYESYVLTLVLFWGMFLPWGHTASIDGRPSTSRIPVRYLSVAGAGLLLQVFFIYFSAGVTKNLGEWVLHPSALLDVLSNPRHGNELGQALTRFPEMLGLLSVATVLVEILLPVLFFVPGKRLPRRRTLLIGVFVVFHAALALVLQLDVFPYVMMVVWCGFLPTQFWERWSSATASDIDPPIVAERSRWLGVVASLALAMVVVSNLITLAYFPAQSGLPGLIQEVARAIPLYQQWTMFSVPSTL